MTAEISIPENSGSKALRLARWLTSTAAAGTGPLSSAEKLAQEYLLDPRYASNDDRVDSLIKS